MRSHPLLNLSSEWEQSRGIRMDVAEPRGLPIKEHHLTMDGIMAPQEMQWEYRLTMYLVQNAIRFAGLRLYLRSALTR